jgi:hypothetical protein
MLDEIPRTEVDESFARTTVEMVAVSGADGIQELRQQTLRRTQRAWALGVAGVGLAAAAGYLVVWFFLDAPNRQLVRDLPIIENLDAYRDAESVDFLRALAHDELFTAEVDDVL